MDDKNYLQSFAMYDENEIYEKLQISADGYTDKEAEKAVSRYGRNEIRSTQHDTVLFRLKRAFDELSKQAPKLARYYMDNKDLLVSQTGYADRIIGKKDAEFYALARVVLIAMLNTMLLFVIIQSGPLLL